MIFILNRRYTLITRIKQPVNLHKHTKKGAWPWWPPGDLCGYILIWWNWFVHQVGWRPDVGLVVPITLQNQLQTALSALENSTLSSESASDMLAGSNPSGSPGPSGGGLRLCSSYRPSEGALWAVVSSQLRPCWWNELRSLFLTRLIGFLAVDWSGLEVSKKDQNNGQITTQRRILVQGWGRAVKML